MSLDALKWWRTSCLLGALALWSIAGAPLAEKASHVALGTKAWAQRTPYTISTPTPVATPKPTPAVTPTPPSSRAGQPTSTPTGTPSRYSSSRKGQKPPTPSPSPQAGKAPAPGATPPGAAPGQKIQRFTQGAPSKGEKAGRGKEMPPKLLFGKDAVQASLHFDPMDLQVKPGEEFEIKLVLSNRSSHPADGLDVAIAYDPHWLTLLASAPTPTLQAAGLKEEPGQIPKPGRLRFSYVFASSVPDEEAELFALKFKAAQSTGFTTLRFLTPPEGVTAVLSKGENVLGDEEQKLRGVVHTYVFVSNAPSNELLPAPDSSQTTQTQEAADEPWVMPGDEKTTNPLQSAWLRVPANARSESGAFIGLQGPERTDLAVGETFWVDLVLYNDDLVPIESVGAKITFDPAALEVVDEDSNNWIMSGVNVWDGAFHENYPFDFHRANNANNARGEILYQIGRQYGVWPFSTGVFARVKFRAKAEADQTVVRLVRAAKTGRPQTYVRSFGIDRMEEFWEKGIPARVGMRIQPASLVSLKNGARSGAPGARASATKTPSAP